jgi:hypothetical protein
VVTSFGFRRKKMFIFHTSVAELNALFFLGTLVYFAMLSVFEDSKAAMVGGLKNGEQEMVWNKDVRRFAAVRSGVGDRLCYNVR